MTHSNTTPSFCVYRIFNSANSKLYIGVTSRKLRVRWLQHLRDARTSHFPIHRAMMKYGVEYFSIEVVETCPDFDAMLEREKYWIQFYDSMAPNGYNVTAGGEGLNGMHHSEETKRKISNKPITPEFRLKMREVAYERSSDPAYLEKLSKAGIGRKHTEAAKQKVREARSKQVFTPESIEKRMQKIRGMKHSEQSIANMSKAQKGRVVSLEHRQKIRKNLQCLTNEQAAIIKFDMCHVQQKDYAAMFGVSPQTVNGIVKGRRYTYITREHLPKGEDTTL